MPIHASPFRGTLVVLLAALMLGGCRESKGPATPPSLDQAPSPELEPVKPPGAAPANTRPRPELALEAPAPSDAGDASTAQADPPILFGDRSAIGTTVVGDLSDVLWDGEHPCVLQDPEGKIVRCWEPRGRQWGAPVDRPQQAAPGILVTGSGTSYKGRQLRLVTRTSGKTRTCSLQEGDRTWQTFTAHEGDGGRSFCPERVTLSPWDRLGSAVALVPAEDASGSPKNRLWWFSTTSPE